MKWPISWFDVKNHMENHESASSGSVLTVLIEKIDGQYTANVTFEEAATAAVSGKYIDFKDMTNKISGASYCGDTIPAYWYTTDMYDVPAFVMNNTEDTYVTLYWTAEGFSREVPSGGK